MIKFTNIINAKDEISKHVVIVDGKGNIIPKIKRYNIETKEAEIYICDNVGKDMKGIEKIILEDSKLMFKIRF